jgi:hypothetical protein
MIQTSAIEEQIVITAVYVYVHVYNACVCICAIRGMQT